jgi:hypothetical protein
VKTTTIYKEKQMIVRVLQSGDSESVGEVVSVPGVGLCQVCDDGLLTSSSQLTTWLSSARSAAEAATLLVWPRLKHVNQSPDTHVYLALDTDAQVVAQITAS